MTGRFLAKTTGASGARGRRRCRNELKSAAPPRFAIQAIRTTRVDGDRASVRYVLVVRGRRFDRTANLVERDGEYRVDGVTK